jgi:tetratricopeptide (TPR) repeat protein
MKRRGALALAGVLVLGGGAGRAAESDPLPVPASGAAARAVRLYNEGVALLVARQFGPAQARFEAALALDEGLAEAHNNLAFSLRMQGRHNLGPALAHYNRALALKPGLAQAYLYRGMLFVQQRDLESARKDLRQLQQRDAKLAATLQRAIDGEPVDERGGIAAQYD